MSLRIVNIPIWCLRTIRVIFVYNKPNYYSDIQVWIFIVFISVHDVSVEKAYGSFSRLFVNKISQETPLATSKCLAFITHIHKSCFNRRHRRHLVAGDLGLSGSRPE